jgi:uncharacterized membrane protein YphA (DoxX/SURF4 family)
MVSRAGASGPPRAQNHAEAGEAHCEQRQRCGLRHGGSSDLERETVRIRTAAPRPYIGAGRHAEAGEVPVVPGVAARQAAARDITSWYEKFTAVLVNADAVAAAPGLASLIETFGGLALLFGFYTRVAAFIMSGEMAVAYFMAHQPRNFFPYNNGGDAAVLYCFVFLYLALVGGGEWSVDAKRAKA